MEWGLQLVRSPTLKQDLLLFKSSFSYSVQIFVSVT